MEDLSHIECPTDSFTELSVEYVEPMPGEPGDFRAGWTGMSAEQLQELSSRAQRYLAEGGQLTSAQLDSLQRVRRSIEAETPEE